MWPTRMPLFIDGAINLSPVQSLRRRSQECGFEEYHLILGMLGLQEEVAGRNRVTAGQPVHPVLVPVPLSSGLHDLYHILLGIRVATRCHLSMYRPSCPVLLSAKIRPSQGGLASDYHTQAVFR